LWHNFAEHFRDSKGLKMTDYSAARTAMVDCQVRPSDVTKYSIIETLLTVPREIYVPSEKKAVAYAGEHIALSSDRFLLDARTFAKMLDAVNIRATDLVLDLGCGLGYSAAVLSRLAEVVVAVEEDAELAAAAADTLSEKSADNVLVINAPLAAGDAKHGPYDVVITQGAIQELPAAILDQIKDGGRIVSIFVENNLGQCRVGLKAGGEIAWRYAFDANAPILSGFETSPEFTF
jgi:protein-L-isoaspartate(D-aspartate) O-methyltransferase